MKTDVVEIDLRKSTSVKRKIASLGSRWNESVRFEKKRIEQNRKKDKRVRQEREASLGTNNARFEIVEVVRRIEDSIETSKSALVE